jgi:glutathione synthase/RimK-type ligase-like ATP-grasp enzyme
MNKIIKGTISRQVDLNNNEVRITRALATELGINDEQMINLRCGQTILLLKLCIVNSNNKFLLLSKENTDVFSLPHEKNYLRITYNKMKKTISFGPVICFLTEINEKSNNPFTTLEGFSQEFQRLVDKEGGIFYLSNFKNYDNNKIEGYYFENGKVVKGNFALPDVVYNRIHLRYNEKKLTHIFKFLNSKSIPYFNDKYLDKWELHNFIYSFPHLRPFVPETLFLNDTNDLSYMLNLYDCIFLKPTSGSQGRSIYKISKLDKGGYILETSFDTSTDPQEVNNIPQLFKKIKRKISNRPYIIQRGIKLLNWNDRNFDIRVLCHQIDEHHWKITHYVARVSHPDKIVSNIAQGGEVQPLDVVLLTSFNQKKSVQIKKFIKEVCIDISTSLNGVLSGIYAEFGIDIGLDEEGKPWIIEVNTKPSKNVTSTNNVIRPSVYSIYHACNYFGFIKE